jgi:tetratricopeptide (TPR) repeat protein
MTDHFSLFVPKRPAFIHPEKMFVAAVKHYTAGRLQQAESALRQLLQQQSKHAQALHLLGVIVHQSGKTDLAILLIAQAIAIEPDVAEFHSNLAEMCRLMKRFDEAVKHGKKAIELNPKSPAAVSNLGIAYYDQGDLDKAEACQKKALKLDPAFPAALNNLGSILRDRKDKQGAIGYYRQVLAINPDHLDAINNLGALLTESERPDEAIGHLLKAIKLAPNYAEAHYNIGNAFLSLEQLDRAIYGFRQALSLKPDYADAYRGLARAYQEEPNLTKAEAMIRKSIALNPGKAESHSSLGEILSLSGYPDKADDAYAKALALDPKHINAYLGRGHLQMERGQLKEAEASFRHALALDNDSIGARLALTQVAKARADDENMAALIALGEALGTMLEAKKLSLHFALGKCYDDTKQYDLAFRHYAAGCALKRKRLTYSADNTDKAGENIRSFFTCENLATLRGAGCDSRLPIFVLGMPRSGTTLTEQIIASHPLVHGAGELPDLLNIACKPHGKETVGYPLSLKDITQADLAMMGERYVSQLQSRNFKAKRITDKMPANFNAIGLIHLMLPNARIIHVKRNPVDTCLSGFTRLFQNSQHHTYDLVEMARYYVNYDRLMRHWRAALPKDAFFEVQYEDLVADTEHQARALIDYCGLEWNDQCLEFYKHERDIRTASVMQVRQPIYTSSIERWRPYGAHLKPLLDILGDLVP